jgi:hypothetical protein
MIRVLEILIVFRVFTNEAIIIEVRKMTIKPKH